MIPSIIHHIAPKKIEKWHPIWSSCRESFKKNFVNFELVLWDDKEGIDFFIQKEYPELYHIFKILPFHVMKIDFARLCILHKFGGIYADMDYYCYKPFIDFLEGDFIIIENDTTEYTSARFENCLMASEPKNPILYNILHYIKICFLYYKHLFKVDNSNQWRNDTTSFAVNNTTGSGMISHFLKINNLIDKINIFPTEFFNNSPLFFSEQLFGKHLHSSLWGQEYIDHPFREAFVIVDNSLHNVRKIDNFSTPWKDFDFYKNYLNDT